MNNKINLNDIRNREDIEKLMTSFYENVLNDMVIGFIFNDVADFDLEDHLPVITDFWETILFGTGKYSGKNRAMDVHFELNKKVSLKKGHFTRWLFLFNGAVDRMYKGFYAEKAKQKASDIANAMQKRLKLVECSDST